MPNYFDNAKKVRLSTTCKVPSWFLEETRSLPVLLQSGLPRNARFVKEGREVACQFLLCFFSWI